MQGLIEIEDGKVFELDSPKGAAWLETIGSFRYKPSGDSKAYTVRREPSGYWYGCRKVAGKLRKRYIGKSSNISIARLEEIAAALEVYPAARVDRVAEVAQDRFAALELEVADLRKALEVLAERLPGKSEPGNSAELPKVNSEVAEQLQNDLSNLKAENEKIRADYDALLESSTAVKASREKEIAELRSQLEAEKTRGEEIWEELSDTEQALAEVRSENSELKKTCAELRSQLETVQAENQRLHSDLGNLEAEREDLAQLKKQVKEHAADVHAEGNAINVERLRWQRELTEARGDLAAAKATIVQQKGKILELERGYSFKPNPAERRLRLEIGELQAQLSELKQKSAAASKDLPEAAGLLNQLKTRRKKATASLADIEAILEILEES